MTKNSQRGSIELIAVTIITLLLISGVGYLAWNNHFEKPAESTRSNADERSVKQSQSDARLKYTASDATFNTSATLKYPDGWSYKHLYISHDQNGNKIESTEPQSNTTNDISRITSPSGNVVIQMDIFINGGIGGTCRNDLSKLAYITREPISSFPGANYLEYIERRGDDTQGYYRYFLGVGRDDVEINNVTLTSNTSCNLVYAGLLNLSKQDADGKDLPIITANMTFKDIDDKSSSEQIKSKFSGDEYETAKDILKSLHLR